MLDDVEEITTIFKRKIGAEHKRGKITYMDKITLFVMK